MHVMCAYMCACTLLSHGIPTPHSHQRRALRFPNPAPYPLLLSHVVQIERHNTRPSDRRAGLCSVGYAQVIPKRGQRLLSLTAYDQGYLEWLDCVCLLIRKRALGETRSSPTTFSFKIISSQCHLGLDKLLKLLE